MEVGLSTKGKLFFAPAYAEKRQKDWEIFGFQHKVVIAWQQFMDSIPSKISIKEHIRVQGLRQLYLEMINGRINPKIGHIVRFKG